MDSDLNKIHDTINFLFQNNHQLKNDNLKLTELNKELSRKNNDLSAQLLKCTDENTNLNKVSYVRSLSTELTNTKKYIEQLEAQLDKYKKINTNINTNTNTNINTNINTFNPDNYVDIDGYKLIKYKKKYYLVHNNNQIYSILDNKPNTIVGSYNNSKVTLN